MKLQFGTLRRFTWEDSPYRPRTVTAEIDHADGSRTLLVLSVEGASETIPAAEVKRLERKLARKAGRGEGGTDGE